jgi:hypothetical protein
LLFFRRKCYNIIPSADKPQPKRLLFTRRRGDAEMFFVINFFTLRLCVSACKKIFCREMAGFHWLIISGILTWHLCLGFAGNLVAQLDSNIQRSKFVILSGYYFQVSPGYIQVGVSVWKEGCHDVYGFLGIGPRPVQLA